MKHLPVAVQLYSVRDEMARDVEGTLSAVHDMGYDGVEFAGLCGLSPKEMKALCEKYSLTPISAHVALDEMLSDPEKVIGDYAEVGVKYIAVPYLQEDRRPGTPGWEKTIADIKLCAKVAKEKGIQMLYHNHDFEFVKINGKYALDILYDEICADLLKTEVDTCWVSVAGEKPADYIRKYTGRSPVVHLKDYVMAGKKPDNMYELIGIKPEGEAASEEAFGFRPVGHGYQDIPAILAASEDAGALWVVVEQDRPGPDKTPVESIRASREYLASLGW
ncbi:MAG: sugar phosphate isomerase/epimerase [Clostridia bacterium]|nr:sugar phosphate isomerase/epimerase [Clostridia bacterium]